MTYADYCLKKLAEMSEEEYMKQYMNHFEVDETFEFFLKCWTVYFEAADKIDGHIKIPQTAYEVKTVNLAGLEASKAMKEYLNNSGYYLNPTQDERWQRAKEEVIRRLEKNTKGREKIVR